MLTSVATLEAESVELGNVRSMAQSNYDAGYRLVTMTVVNLGNGYLDILYHFDKKLRMRHYRLTVPVNTVVPSISGIYFCAFLIENESRDHYGLIFEGLVVDFQGSLYLEKDTPPPLLRGPSCTISTIMK